MKNDTKPRNDEKKTEEKGKELFFLKSENFEKALKGSSYKGQKDLATAMVNYVLSHLEESDLWHDWYNVNESQISNWKKGRSIPYQHLKAMSIVLGVTEKYLTGKSRNMKVWQDNQDEYLREKYGPIFAFCKALGYEYQVKQDPDGKLLGYFNPPGEPPICVDDNLFQYLLDNAKHHFELVFADYYKSNHALLHHIDTEIETSEKTHKEKIIINSKNYEEYFPRKE